MIELKLIGPIEQVNEDLYTNFQEHSKCSQKFHNIQF